MERADLERKVKWGNEVGGQSTKWEVIVIKTDKCKEKERWERKSEERGRNKWMKTGQWMRLWKVISGLVGREVWHYLTNSPSGGHLLKLFTSRNSLIFMYMNDASTRTCKKKKIFIFQMSRDGSDQRLWMSLILSKMEHREQIKNAA